MPYELTFSTPFPIAKRDEYINECCVGGDLVVDLLIPEIRARYEKVRSEQEDWGWFIWFHRGAVALAIDIFCDDPERRRFRVHLTSRRKKWLVLDTISDGPELEELLTLVAPHIERWVEGSCQVLRVDERYDPIDV